MKLYLSSTANLGDFMNAYPVMSGLAQRYKIDLVIKKEMSKFRDFREFLFYQDRFESISFDNEISLHESVVLSSWTHMTRNTPDRPIETCRYENWLRDNYKLEFEVDDQCQLQVPDIDIDCYPDRFIIGDRWGRESNPEVDDRRLSHVVRDGADIDQGQCYYLDYSRSIFENCSIIKNNPNKFITTFTGIGIIADLMNKETVVCWDEDMRIWDGHPVEFDWERHYYRDRKSQLIHVKDLQL